MAGFPDERQLVVRARSQLDQWTKSARIEAYAELFEGNDPILSPEEVYLLDALNSELERQGGDGVWGTDQYGIHTAGTTRSDSSVGIVCVYHPQITKEGALGLVPEVLHWAVYRSRFSAIVRTVEREIPSERANSRLFAPLSSSSSTTTAFS
ncbi:DUF7539 family protein [Halocatena salina]|uniref:Uncharacterized protein n=1 Tax=Halocatena salina TaxID=2934340 RepID=A0A8U0A7Y4_9EURY|nr:hypothetical protein [Halocatena salina]UPM45245.1 hypothetical protein MW046_19040 [Halocatena salina]